MNDCCAPLARLRLAGGLLMLTGMFAALAQAQPLAEIKLASADESKAEYNRVVVPFLAKHCNDCHNQKDSEGDLDLTQLDFDMKASTSGARWATLVEKLTKGEMPPKKRTRPNPEAVAAVIRWANAEAKRANRHFTRREAYANGNKVPHDSLFDPKHIPPFAADPQIRRISPEIYAAFLAEMKVKSGLGQPFSPSGRTTFKDMGAPKVDEPVTAQLLQNALVIVEGRTAHKLEGDKVVGNMPRELSVLFDPKTPPSDPQIEAAIVHQFNQILSRTPTDLEKSRFVALMKKNIADAGQTVGVRHTLATVLMLPEAIFRMGVGSGTPDAKGRIRLAPREIAFALAFALTDKRPDAALLAAAATGGLDTDTGVAKQVQRLLDDPKTEKTRILRFFREYFGYDRATETFKENGPVPELNHPSHEPRALVEDTDRLVLFILEQDKEVLKEMLTTTKSFVAYKSAAGSKKTIAVEKAKFEADKQKDPVKFKDKVFKPQPKLIYESYGLTDFPDVQPVDLPADQRAGILTQPSWLVAHSTTFDNHAIHRGKWIREHLLGGVVPDVPITVDAQLPIAPEKTLRARMAVTQEAYCWKCHQLMNDLAYPFEQFDHFGRYRTAEIVQDLAATALNMDSKGKSKGPVMKSAPLDISGLIAHVGDQSLEGSVKNPIDYLKKLAASKHVEQVFVRHAFRFWVARNEAPGDAASLQATHKAYRESGGSMKALITALLTSESFLYYVPSKPTT
jgi:hypothetical protein